MLSYGFLSTHPPTRCGLATFNSALAAHLTADGARGGIVRVTDRGDDQRPGPGVVHTWSTRTPTGWRDAAAILNTYDVAVVQHEYGIYPGADGEDVLPLLRRLTVPSIVVLHTVLRQPSARQKSLLEQIVTVAGAVVTMTDTARDRLLVGYTVPPGKVTVIPHGAAEHVGAPVARRTRPHLLTWGLLGPGKGVEWSLRALARLQDLDPTPTYTVAGRTHPKVIEHQGEAYRSGLHRLGAELGIAHAVDYQDVYHDQVALGRLIRSADVVVLPYDSREQVTSGVLIEAVAAGVPVVSTAFPHAVELLTGGPGLVVPHRDPAALAAAIRRILVEPGLAARLAGRVQPLAAHLRWPAVAARYGTLAERLTAARPSVVSAASA
ncbi:glycosyltransferase involved in cell wall biosynthesis [Micromonospora palomenae]|uniref:Glycosyltransferase involved in cell wall biosynthesis n=1 Tax=Micromonospora palomenae TaxID=1461247 RepID=A0A561WDR5_9ACTN|nr:glycosyltransferase [Micromonospora palomenae]TWG22001.1 glycosyltransferase involved in cell wall biosynthesis [Micromonospora palomenae]